VKGANIVMPYQGASSDRPTVWAEMWETWDWSAIKAKIDLSKTAGCNTIRVMGSVQAVMADMVDQATYLGHWSQLIEHTNGIGMYVYACGGDGYDGPGYDNFSTYAVNDPTGYVAELVALAELLDTKPNIMGFDVWQENPLYSLRSTAAAAVRAVTDIPITFSTFADAIQSTTYRDTVRSDVDFFDHHIYTFNRAEDISGYWSTTEFKPLLFGEFGTTIGNADAATKYATLRGSVEFVADGERSCAGAVVWHIQDYSTETFNYYGLYEADGDARTSHLSNFQLFPTTFDTNVVAGQILDTFTRPDTGAGLGTSDSGHVWTHDVGLMGVSLVRGYPQTLVSSEAISTVPFTSTDHVVKITPKTVGSSRYVGVVGRFVDSDNYYLAQTDDTGSQLWKKVAGTFTQLGSTAAVVAVDTVLELRCSGSTISLWGNGSQLIWVTDTSLTTGTRTGIRIGSSTTAPRFDTFVTTP
jgi:hypothetical protein